MIYSFYQRIQSKEIGFCFSKERFHRGARFPFMLVTCSPSAQASSTFTRLLAERWSFVRLDKYVPRKVSNNSWKVPLSANQLLPSIKTRFLFQEEHRTLCMVTGRRAEKSLRNKTTADPHECGGVLQRGTVISDPNCSAKDVKCSKDQAINGLLKEDFLTVGVYPSFQEETIRNHFKPSSASVQCVLAKELQVVSSL